MVHFITFEEGLKIIDEASAVIVNDNEVTYACVNLDSKEIIVSVDMDAIEHTLNSTNNSGVRVERKALYFTNTNLEEVKILPLKAALE